MFGGTMTDKLEALINENVALKAELARLMDKTSYWHSEYENASEMREGLHEDLIHWILKCNSIEAKLKIATEALEYYADHSSWIAEGIKGLGLQSKRRSIHESDVNFCGGKRARETLEKIK